MNVDVDSLFEKHSVAEIESVQKQIRDEIERKKEELRSMVGERYRDLLKAADRIYHMKTTSSNVIQNIENVLDKCKTVNERQITGFNRPVKTPLPATQQLSDYSVTLQIRILAQLPELIWRHLDNDEFFIATQLFIFARHINTGLRLNKSSSVALRFPLVKNQWATLQQFLTIIKDRCHSRLELEDLQPEVAAKCLASLVLLDSPSAENLLQNLLNLRVKAFCDVLNDNSGKFSVVRDKLLASLGVLNGTVLLVHRCFVELQGDSGRGLLAVELNRLSGENSPFTISHFVSTANSNSLQFLPDIIAKYRPTAALSEVPINSVHLLLRQWLATLSGIAGTNVKTLVNLISSVKVIREIKETSLARENKISNNWTQICRDLDLPGDLNFYRQFFHSLINERVKAIIQSSWTETRKSLEQQIHLWLEETGKEAQKMGKFLWTEETTDIPLSLRAALDPDVKRRKLLMKSRGFVPEVVKICTKFDENLKTLFQDVDNYLAKDGASQVAEEMKRDQEDLVKFLIAASKQAIEEFLTSLTGENKIQDKESFLQIARLLQAIRDLCPHLRMILCYRLDGGSALKTEGNWQFVAKQLEDESIAYWIRFADQFFAEFCLSVSLARPLTDYATVLEEFAAWQAVAIEEKDEQGGAIQSTIRVPSQPSLRLQTTLFKLTTEVNKIAPHTIPTQVVAYLMERVAGELLSNYAKLGGGESEFVKENQHVSLQFYFDVRYISLLLIPRENKKLSEEALRIQNLFKGHVDPFDFELFFVHVTKNVKTAAQRTQNQLGVIIPNMENVLTVLGGGGEKQTISTDKEPNVLALSNSSVTWFPLLPIAAPVVKEEVAVKEEIPVKRAERSSQEGRSGGRSGQGQQQSGRSQKPSSAASFFGNFFQN